MDSGPSRFFIVRAMGGGRWKVGWVDLILGMDWVDLMS